MSIIIVQRDCTALHLLIQVTGILSVLVYGVDLGLCELAARRTKLGAVISIVL
ncbi:hypothetical protein [Gemmiger sp.]